MIDRLRVSFVREFSAELVALEAVLEAARQKQHPHADAVQRAGEFFHRLAGVAETFGLSTLGRLAAVCDRIADVAKASPHDQQEPLFEIMCMGAGATHESLRELDSSSPS